MENARSRTSRRLTRATRAATFFSIFVAGGVAVAQTKAPPRREAPTTNEPAHSGATTASATAPGVEPPKLAPPADDDPNTENKRGVYLSADIGYTHPNIGAFSNKLAFDKTSGNGFNAGLGVGYRQKALRFGFRFRAQDTTPYTLYSVMGEVGYGLPIKPLTPVIFFHAGYMFSTSVDREVIASSLPNTNILTPDVSVNGLVLGLEAYGQYAVTKVLKLGPFISFDATFLHRPQPDAPESTQPLGTDTTDNALFGSSGHGVGYVFNVGLRLTGDIAF